MFDTQQLLQISRKMKKDEESQDRERKFVPKRLGMRMVAKENCKNVGDNFTTLLITNICEMNYIVNLHTIISHQPFGISPIYNEIPCKMLARLNRQGKQQGSSATKYVIDNVFLHNPFLLIIHNNSPLAYFLFVSELLSHNNKSYKPFGRRPDYLLNYYGQ